MRTFYERELNCLKAVYKLTYGGVNAARKPKDTRVTVFAC
jgi:hypothetical protein